MLEKSPLKSDCKNGVLGLCVSAPKGEAPIIPFSVLKFYFLQFLA